MPVWSALAAYQAWTTSLALAGTAALPDAAPRGEGVPNLLKYAFNMNGAGPDTSILAPAAGTRGLPLVSVGVGVDGIVLRVEYVRRLNAGLVYTPKIGTILTEFAPMTAVPVVTETNGSWERVLVEEPIGLFPRAQLFCIVSVEMP